VGFPFEVTPLNGVWMISCGCGAKAFGGVAAVKMKGTQFHGCD